jgi:hypothetical protein
MVLGSYFPTIASTSTRVSIDSMGRMSTSTFQVMIERGTRRCTIVAPDGDPHPPFSIKALLARYRSNGSGHNVSSFTIPGLYPTRRNLMEPRKRRRALAFVTPPFVLIGAVNAFVKQVLCHRPLK